MSYPPVQIHNSTNYSATGTVDYASIFCSNDNYQVDAGKTWTGPGRGVCLVTQITAVLLVDGKQVQAAVYQSSGTSYSQYAIIQTKDGFAVTRVTSGLEVPEGHVEPTTKQK
jgi:hypothetical protein